MTKSELIILCYLIIVLLFFFLIIDLYFLIPASIAQFFNFIAELVIPIGIHKIKDSKSKIEIHPVIAEAKIVPYKIEVFHIKSSCRILFALSTHQFILLYFFK